MTPRTDITFTNPSPDRKWFLRAPAADRGDIDAYGKSHINLGGLQIDTKANRARTVTTSTRHALTLVDPRTMATRTIETPKGATLWAQTWSPNGAQIAYIANFDDASHIFVADAATGKATQITKTPLNATLVTTLDWTADGKGIVTVLVPEGRGPVPVHGKANGVEDGPEVRLTESRVIPQVIHPSLLEDPHDKAQLKYYTTGQLAIVDVKSKTVKKIGAPTTIRAVDASPDGQYFRVTRMVEPYSYIVPVAQFGSVQELWDATGKVIATLNKTPLREGGRGGDDPDAAPAGRGAQSSPSDTGKRNVQWNPVGPGLVYMQSVFAGDRRRCCAGWRSRRTWRGSRWSSAAGTASAEQRAVCELAAAPYGPTDTRVIYEGTGRLTSVAYSADGQDDVRLGQRWRVRDPLGRTVEEIQPRHWRHDPRRWFRRAWWRRWSRWCWRRCRQRRCVGNEDGRTRRTGCRGRQRQQDGVPLWFAHAGSQLDDARPASVGRQTRLRVGSAFACVRRRRRCVR